MKHVLIRSLFVLSMLSAAAAVPPPERLHTITVGTVPDQAAADMLASRLEMQGFSPIWQTANGGAITVNFGRFDTNSEAWGISQQMTKFGFLDVKVTSSENAGNAVFDSVYTTPAEPLIVQKNPKRAIVGLRDFAADARVGTLRAAAAQGEADLAIASGAALIESLSDDDPLKAFAMVETAREIVKKEKESKNALPYLMRVAKQEVAATEKELVEARFMLADSWHYYWFAPLKGYRAYKEILAAHGDDPGVVARCRVEMAACLLEMARMPDAAWKASFEDVRRECQRILEEVPADYDRARATADLIYCETYLYEVPPRYAESLKAFEGFDERHPGRIREISMANNMRAECNAELKNWPAAKQWWERTLAMDLSDPSECFYWKGERWNLKENAAKWLCHYAKLFSDRETELRCIQYLDAKQHEAGLAGRAARVDASFPHGFYGERKAR